MPRVTRIPTRLTIPTGEPRKGRAGQLWHLVGECVRIDIEKRAIAVDYSRRIDHQPVSIAHRLKFVRDVARRRFPCTTVEVLPFPLQGR